MSANGTPSKHPPVVKGNALMGSLPRFAGNPLGFFENTGSRFDKEGIFGVTSPFFKISKVHKGLVFITKPDYAKHVLQENNRNYCKNFGYEKMKLLLGEGLVTSEGDFWRKQRRLMQPAFHHERMAGIAAIVTDECRCVMENWKALPDKSVVNLSRDLMQMTLRIIGKALFTTDVDDVIETLNRELYIANERMIGRILNPFSLPIWVPTPGNYREKQAHIAIHQVVGNVIARRRKSGTQHSDLMAMLMEARDEETGEPMSDKQIEDEAVTIFLAGHETTTVALTWLFYCLAENPDIESRLLDEARTILNNQTPQFEHLKQPEYTRMVIEETMRIYPPVWVIGRYAMGDDVIDGWQVPAGSNVLLSVISIHHNPTYWPEPEKFIPERFTKENIKNRHRYAYFPFGGGPRLCIGSNMAMMEMQLALPMIVQQFSLRTPAGFTCKRAPLITMRPEPEMQMVVSRREV